MSRAPRAGQGTLKLKGISVGQSVVVSYLGRGTSTHSTDYEGVLCDRHVGASDRESYLELEGCKKVGHAGPVDDDERMRFIDAFVESVRIRQPTPEREEPPPQTEEAAQLGTRKPAKHSENDCAQDMSMGMIGMGMGMGMGMAPAMGMTPAMGMMQPTSMMMQPSGMMMQAGGMMPSGMVQGGMMPGCMVPGGMVMVPNGVMMQAGGQMPGNQMMMMVPGGPMLGMGGGVGASVAGGQDVGTMGNGSGGDACMVPAFSKAGAAAPVGELGVGRESRSRSRGHRS